LNRSTKDETEEGFMQSIKKGSYGALMQGPRNKSTEEQQIAVNLMKLG
jgi:hypothetical protein